MAFLHCMLLHICESIDIRLTHKLSACTVTFKVKVQTETQIIIKTMQIFWDTSGERTLWDRASFPRAIFQTVPASSSKGPRTPPTSSLLPSPLDTLHCPKSALQYDCLIIYQLDTLRNANTSQNCFQLALCILLHWLKSWPSNTLNPESLVNIVFRNTLIILLGLSTLIWCKGTWWRFHVD